MRGIERLKSVDMSIEPLAEALPDLPKDETSLVRLIRIASYGLSDYFTEVFKNMGVTENTFHMLAILCASEHGQYSPTELSELIGTSRANMTKIIAVLEKQGYVKRESGKLDGRQNFVVLTAEGRELVGRVTPIVASPIQMAFSGLSATERKKLGQLLRKAILSFDDAKIYHSLKSSE